MRRERGREREGVRQRRRVMSPLPASQWESGRERGRGRARGQRRVCFYHCSISRGKRGTINFTETRKKRRKQIRTEETYRESERETERERRISRSCWSERALLQKVRTEKRERACADELVSMLMRLRSRWPFTPLLDVSLQSASVAAAPDAHVLCQVCVEEN